MKTVIALAAASVLAAAPAAAAADFTVTGGTLDWTIANHYASGDPDRTWLGYATNATGPGAANGSVAATAPATLRDKYGAATTIVDAASPRGLDRPYTLTYPAAGGTYTSAGTGTIELAGTFTFTIHAAQGLRPITMVDPVVTLDGLTGTLRATGVSADGAPYDRAETQFALDLSAATVALRPDGSGRVISGIVPVSTPDTQLSGFGVNSRRYGTMTLRLALTEEAADPVTPAAGRDGAAGAPGAAGPAGPTGRDGRDAELRVIRLARAPFATRREVHVRLIDRVTGKSIARGTVQRRTLRLGVLSGTRLKGPYLLKRTAKRAAGKLQARITVR